MGDSGSQTGAGGVAGRGGDFVKCFLKDDNLIVKIAGVVEGAEGGCSCRRCGLSMQKSRGVLNQ